jgi:hypothetical protein
VSIFDHAGTDVKNDAMPVQNVRIPPACELTIAPIV